KNHCIGENFMDHIKDHGTGRKKRVVIKLSGSIFSQDTNYAKIRKYAEMLSDISNRVQPIVIAGGGKVARHYINLARNLGSDEANLDIIGIEVSRLNAKLLITALGDQAYSQVPKNLEEVAIALDSSKIVIAGGLHPGQSTNATSALIAETSKASSFVNATDVDGIYDSDPNTNTKARLFKEITVNECMEILRVESAMAGTYDLMDIIALKVIERSKIPTRVVRSDTNDIRDAVDGKDIGTKIITFRKQS
ncbi:MAG TPA: UMP kinase, partial [Nitrososphaeraceae archaeon]|nr:UMP kinase [Nitrososphaeraceae archaeon]